MLLKRQAMEKVIAELSNFSSFCVKLRGRKKFNVINRFFTLFHHEFSNMVVTEHFQTSCFSFHGFF